MSTPCEFTLFNCSVVSDAFLDKLYSGWVIVTVKLKMDYYLYVRAETIYDKLALA